MNGVVADLVARDKPSVNVGDSTRHQVVVPTSKVFSQVINLVRGKNVCEPGGTFGVKEGVVVM